MTERRLPLPKRFPGRVVARAKIWFGGHTVGIEGPIAPELGRLIIAAWFSNKQDPKMLARFDAIAREIQGEKEPKKLTDRALRSQVSSKRAQGILGRKAK